VPKSQDVRVADKSGGLPCSLLNRDLTQEMEVSLDARSFAGSPWAKPLNCAMTI
jgi:hypothetical protein